MIYRDTFGRPVCRKSDLIAQHEPHGSFARPFRGGLLLFPAQGSFTPARRQDYALIPPPRGAYRSVAIGGGGRYGSPAGASWGSRTRDRAVMSRLLCQLS